MSFYVTGGTLRQDAPSYVERQADKDLLDGLLKGEFCYVLTSRQMGKSSLMVRTAQRLREAGARVAILDLTAIGQNLTVEQWYDGLMSKLGQQLDLEDELLDFWRANEAWGPLLRWMTALEKVVLPNVGVQALARPPQPETRDKPKLGLQPRLVIFVDEIDLVRSLPFSTDEFFAAIRECYNRRSRDPVFARVSFCLLGVATPSDLIRNVRMTPFNIGRRIELNDFTEAEAAPLAKGLAQNDQIGQSLLSRVLYWTHGHPYLTQRLCRAMAETGNAISSADVDRQCEELFLSSKARECDDNLIFVRERMLKSEVGLAELLALYAQILKDKPVPDVEANPLVSVLRLSGVARGERGVMRVRNNIYARVFDAAWVRANMPEAEVRRQRAAFRRGAVRAAALGVAVLAMLVFWAIYQSPNQPIEQRLKDGSMLRLEKVTHGRRHSFERGPFRTAWLRGLLPFLPAKSAYAITSSSTDSVVLWLSRRDPQTGAELDWDWLATMTAEDEHGCRFWPGVCGFCSGSSMTSSIQHFPSFTRPTGAKDLVVACEFPSFPRRQRMFKLVFYDHNSQAATELSVPNPVSKGYPQWTPNQLPASQQAGALKFSLISLSNRVQTAEAAGIISDWVLPVTRFAVTRNGQPTKDWAATGTTFSDATDNRWGGEFYSGGGICSQESAWKVRAEFFRTPQAQFSPQETWTVETMSIPPDGSAKALAISTNLGSKRLELHSIGGPGQYAYSNDQLISAKPNAEGNQSYGRSTSGNGLSLETRIATRLPHLLLSVQDLTPGGMVAFRGVDDQGHRIGDFLGRDVYRFQCVELALASNATKVTLSFMVYTGLVAEFVVPPPLAPKVPIRALSAADKTALASSIPDRDTGAGPNMVDLANYYTVPLRGEARRTSLTASGPIPNGSGSGSYDLQRLPAGPQKLDDVDFDMRGLVQLNGLALKLATRRAGTRAFDFPWQIENIHLSKTCRRLHLLHGCLWTAMEGTAIGRYVFNFADGQTAEQPIIYGRDVRSFSPLPGESTPPGSPDPVWTDSSGATRYQLFKFTWVNPHPDVEIKSMDFISAQTLAAPFLIAVTAEP